MKKKVIIILIVLALSLAAVSVIAFGDGFFAEEKPENPATGLLPGQEPPPEWLVSAIRMKEEEEALEKDELNAQFQHLIGTTKELTVQGKTLTATYKEAEKASRIKKHDSVFYETENGERLGYDAVTGQLVYLWMEKYGDISYSQNPRISAEQAVAIAEEFITAHCDISRYTFLGCEYRGNSSTYSVCFGLLVQDYQTSEEAYAVITESGEISIFGFNPYAVDDVDVNSIDIDEQVLIEKLEQQIKKGKKENWLVSYEIKEQRLCVNEDNQPYMWFFVAQRWRTMDENGTVMLDEDGNERICVSGEYYEIEL